MTITMLYSKLHRATVTDANLNYVGSITIDQELLDASEYVVGQKVDIVNINMVRDFKLYYSWVRGANRRILCLNGCRQLRKGFQGGEN